MAIPIPNELQRKYGNDEGYRDLETRPRFCPRLSFVLDDPKYDVAILPHVEVELDDKAMDILERIYSEQFKEGFREYREGLLAQDRWRDFNAKNADSPAKKKGYVYFIKVKGKDLFKIGITKQSNVVNRVANIQSSCPYLIELHSYYSSEDCEKEEVELHDRFKDKRTHGEWFNLTLNEVETLLVGGRENGRPGKQD